MRPGPAALLILLLAAPAAAQLPATGWTAQLALDAPGAADLTRGNATAIEVTLRYAVGGGLCAAGQAPPGTATLALAASAPEGISAAVEDARSIPLACGETAATFLLTLTPAAGAAAGGHAILLTADASPACTLPCGITAQRAEAALTVTLPDPPQPPARPPAGGTNLTNLSTHQGHGGGADGGATTTAGEFSGPGLALILGPAVAGLVAALLVALLVMNRIAR